LQSMTAYSQSKQVLTARDADGWADRALSLHIVAVQLQQAIQERTGRRVVGLDVAPIDGQIVVRGQVRSYHVKQLALAAAVRFLEGTDVQTQFVLEVVP